MESSYESHNPVESSRSTSRRLSIPHMIILLLIVAVVFIGFNFLLGDYRRKQNAIAQAQMHAQHYTRLAGESGLLPLNLQPKIEDDEITKMFRMEWLNSLQVRKHRNSHSPVIIAQTIELPLFLSSNGRAVILYHEGKYTVQWMTSSEFNQNISQQQEIIDQ